MKYLSCFFVVVFLCMVYSSGHAQQGGPPSVPGPVLELADSSCTAIELQSVSIKLAQAKVEITYKFLTNCDDRMIRFNVIGPKYPCYGNLDPQPERSFLDIMAFSNGQPVKINRTFKAEHDGNDVTSLLQEANFPSGICDSFFLSKNEGFWPDNTPENQEKYKKLLQDGVLTVNKDFEQERLEPAWWIQYIDSFEISSDGNATLELKLSYKPLAGEELTSLTNNAHTDTSFGDSSMHCVSWASLQNQPIADFNDDNIDNMASLSMVWLNIPLGLTTRQIDFIDLTVQIDYDNVIKYDPSPVMKNYIDELNTHEYAVGICSAGYSYRDSYVGVLKPNASIVWKQSKVPFPESVRVMTLRKN